MKPDLTHGQAVAWSASVTLGFLIVAREVALAVPGLLHDLVLQVGVEIVVYLAACALFSARRPGRTFEDVFAFRRAPVLLLAAAGALGLALRAPADFVETWIQKQSPLPKGLEEEFAAMLVPHSALHAVALALVVGLCGPFVEELLYRGALFTGLRSTAGAGAAAVTTGVLFTVVHPEPRFWPPVFALAACLGFLRATSGSLWPCVLMHGVFNGTAVVMAFSGGKTDAFELKPAVVGGSFAAAVLLLALVGKLARGSAIAERARSLDVHPVPDGRVES
ncbi:MAG TPA: CPBP family intramembrane glutamic endopeptidase [Polyangiaceae bacterium]|nr:CPBP family intramembrane glutamic endopeptidase [Polyangiaceae bacterium]